MSRSNWRLWLPLSPKPASAQRRRPYKPALEVLEDRATPATHVWSGVASSLMSLDTNWSAGGRPVVNEIGPVVLVFPNTAARFNVIDDIDGLRVDLIQFTGAASKYVISGSASGVTVNISGAGTVNIDDQVGGNVFSATGLTLALAGTATVNVAAGALTINSPITGAAGLIKTGSGTFTLVGANTYTGLTTIKGGVLEVDSAIGDVSLTGGTLSGIGAVGTISGQPPANAPAAGVIAPGASGPTPIGTLRSKSVTWGPGSTFAVDLSHPSTGSPVPGTDNDLFAVTGNIILGGATLTGSVLPGVLFGDRFTVIQTTGGTVQGAFASGASVFLGSAKFNIDTSDLTKVVLVRVPAATSVTVSSSLNPAVYGQAVLYMATVKAEAGAGPIPITDTITFTFDGVSYPAVSVDVNGQATFDPQKATGAPLGVTAATAPHTLHVVFNGDSALAASSTDLSPGQTVNNPTIADQTLSYRQSTLTVPLPPGDTVTSAGSMAFFYHRDLGLALAAGGLFENFVGINEKWLHGNANAFGNPWYFIKPDGQLFAWDGTPAARGSALIGTLDPVYYSYPDLIFHATADTLDLVLRQRLGLAFGGDFFQNYGGRDEKWLRGNTNPYGNPWYFIDSAGRLYAWNGVANQANGTLLAALDTLYWAEPQRLFNAQANEATAALVSGALTVTTVNNWAGRLVVEVNSTTPVVTHQIFTLNFVNHAPTLTVTPAGDQTTAPGQPLVLTLHASDADADTLTFTPVTGHLGYVLDQSLGLRLQDSLAFNYGGQNEEWLQSTLNNWYFIKPDGELFLWDGTPNQATGTLVSTLDPIYYYRPDLLYDAPAGDLAFALHERLGLRGTTADFSRNFGGLDEKWLLGADGWYFLRADGALWKWRETLNGPTGTLAQPDGAVDPAAGIFMTSLDPLDYTNIDLLVNAQPKRPPIRQAGNTLTVTPDANDTTDVWLMARASDGSQTVSTPPVRLVSRPDTITFWERTGERDGNPTPFTLAVNSPQLTTRSSDPLGPTNADFVTAANEYYDVFFSNADGTFNASGAFVTIEASFAYALPYGGGLNIARVDINHLNGTTEHYGTVSSFASFGDNALATSMNNAVDGNLNTWTTLGNTIGQTQRLRLTLGLST